MANLKLLSKVGAKKPSDVKQGLKICIYGKNGLGKSAQAYLFPDVVIQDTESKAGTYTDKNGFKDTIQAVIDTNDFSQTIDIEKTLFAETEKPCETFVTDSATVLFNNLSVTMLEVEEQRAIKNKKDVLDQSVSMRGHGRIKLENQRLQSLRAKASTMGVTMIDIAWEEDVMVDSKDKNGNPIRVKVGIRPMLKKNAEHDYDVIFHVISENDLATGNEKIIFVVEKDTTRTRKKGTKIDVTMTDEEFNTAPKAVIYDIYKEAIQKGGVGTKGVSNYDNIDKNVEETIKEAESFDQISNEFKELYKIKKDSHGTAIATKMKELGIAKITDQQYADQIKMLVEWMKGLQ